MNHFEIIHQETLRGSGASGATYHHNGILQIVRHKTTGVLYSIFFTPTTDAPATMTLLVDRDGNPLTYL